MQKHASCPICRDPRRTDVAPLLGRPGCRSRFLNPQRRPLLLLALTIVATAGCSGNSVREDRSIVVSPGGGQASFQHGNSGIFIEQDGALRSIYEPSNDCLAVSTPIYSQDGKSLIFCVAKPRNRETESANASSDAPTEGVPEAWDTSPEGRRFWPGDVTYAVMHYILGQESEPTELFSADVNHTGYVAGNMAVQWFANDKKILFVDQPTSDTWQLCEYSLESKKRAKLWKASATAIVFHVSASEENAICMLATPNRQVELWRGQLSTDSDWEQVGFYQSKLQDSDVTGLATLQQLAPAGEESGERIALTSLQTQGGAGPKHQLWVFDVAEDAAELQFESPHPISHTHWGQAGEKIGFCVNGELVCVDTSSQQILWRHPNVRSFAGWSPDGDSIAFTSVDAPLVNRWCLLVLPQMENRDTLCVASTHPTLDTTSTHNLVQGLRITFPSWAPKDRELLFWGTLTPSHRGALSMLLDAGMPFGDPAARLKLSDTDNLQINWLPIDGDEMLQIGHYYLGQNDEEKAWNWYEKARTTQTSATGEPAHDGAPSLRIGSTGLFQSSLQYQLPHLFQAICLQRLGRDDQANRALEFFIDTYRMPKETIALLKAQASVDDGTAKTNIDQDAADFNATITPYFRTNYEFEVYLSLQALDEYAKTLDVRLEQATDDELLAAELAHSQLLLINGQAFEFSLFSIHSLLPKLAALASTSENLLAGSDSPIEDFRDLIAVQGLALAVAPLFSKQFYDQFDSAQRQTIYEKMAQARSAAATEHSVALHQWCLDALQKSMQQHGVVVAEAEYSETVVSQETQNIVLQLFAIAQLFIAERDWEIHAP